MDAHTEAMPDDASWLDGVVVPDDLSELQPDVEAYHRELRHAARRRRFARVTRTAAWQRFALPATVAIGSLAVAGAVLAILTLGHQRPIVGTPATPIATSPVAAAGQIGGLLPSLTVRTDTGPINVRDLRPALVALVPLHCNCATLINNLAGQAQEANLQVVVVAPSTTDAEVAALPGQVHDGIVRTVFDLHAQLAKTYSAVGVTVLGLRPDGVVSFVKTAVDAGVPLELPMQEMVGPTASLSQT
jgi:hypothetical protein